MVLFCAVYGLYERIVDSLVNFFKDIKNNIKFLFPIGIGTLVGIFTVGNVLKILFSKYTMQTSFAFIGLILGSIKLIIKEANIKRIRFTHILCFLFTLSFSIFLVTLEKNNSFVYYSQSIDSKELILCGFLMSAGIIIPGLSKTVILMFLGIYELYLTSISTLNFSFLVPLGIGIIIGSIIFLIVFNFLFKRFKSHTYFGIIGFVLGSIFILYPGFTFNNKGLISIILFVICLIVGLKLSNLKNTSKNSIF